MSVPGPSGRLLVDGLLPAGAVAAEAYDDERDAAGVPVSALLAVERDVARGRSERRRREATTARHCAREALRALGHAWAAVPRLASGAPRWPDGVVGSITHCDGYRGAVVARRADVPTLGLDAERHAPLPQVVRDHVVRPDEHATVAALAARGVHGDRVLFSAKEAVFKAWHPVAGTTLGFLDARVELGAPRSTGAGEVRAHVPHVAGGPSRLVGRWAVRRGLVVVVVAGSPDGRGPSEW